MANLAVQTRQTGPNEYVYFVVDVDQNLSIATFANLELANQFAAAGDDSDAALLAARQENINATGGVRDAPTTQPPVFVPAVTPPGGGVTYETIAKDDPIAKQLNDANAAREAERVQNTRSVAVQDPLYAGGVRFEVVPKSQERTSANAVPNTATTFTTPVIFDQPANQVQNSATPVLDTSIPLVLPPVTTVETAAQPVPTYRAEYNPIINSWVVVNANTGQVLSSGLTEEQAKFLVLDENAPTPTTPQPKVAGADPYGTLDKAYDEAGLLRPGFTLDEDNDPVFVGNGFVEPATLASAAQSRIEAQTREAQRQQVYIDQQRQINNQDWRLRLSLAPQSNYLYNVPDAGILNPLKPSNGVIFPYTPQISTSYKANYNPTDLTHSNYRGYFYQNSYTDSVTVTATFTAQNTREASYLLAVIHFFRSVTKMIYGQSQNLGSPPPICYLNGLGEFQFNKHPVVVSQFNYTLPSDVDYIRAGSSNNLQLNQDPLRDKQATTTNSGLNSVLRLANAFLKPGGARDVRPSTSFLTRVNSPTYVPTKMEIVITLLPMQSRTQISQQFNLQTFANGNQLRGGFW